MRLLASLFLCVVTLPVVSYGQTAQAEPPKVRTVDLPSLIATARPPVTITSVQGAPGTSVNSEQIEWRGEEGKEMARVAALPPIDLQSNGNDLRSVIRAVCSAANMKFTIVGDDPAFDAPVTQSGSRRPWEMLQTLANIYDLEIVYRYGNWMIYAVNNNELVERTYLLRYNTLEKFTAGSATGGSAGGDSADTRPDQADSSQRSTGKSQNPSLDRTGQSVFKSDSKALTDAVSKFIGLQVHQANIAGANGSLGVAGPRRGGGATKQETAPAGGFVQFTSENNTLFVVATRAQHELLAAWIAQMDQPQKQIQIESKFLLTSVSPGSHMGVSNPLFTEDGISAGFSGIKNTNVNLTNPNTWRFDQAIMTASDLQAKLAFVQTNSDTSTVQYPTQVTLSGNEVTLRSVRQIPIVSSSMRDTSGSATNTQASITFEDVGTVVAILPKVQNEKDVVLNISIQVSAVVDTVLISGNPYPVVTQQTYQNKVIVESGYSLALGGLEQSIRSTQETKLPFFGNIPFFGFLAKDINKSNTHSVLTMIVTPVIMSGYNGGNTSGLAQNTLPSRGTIERVVFERSEGTTIEDVQVSLRGFDRDVEEVAQVAKEGRGDNRQYARTQLLLNELNLMSFTLKRERNAGRAAPTLEMEISNYRKRLQAIAKAMPKTAPIS